MDVFLLSSTALGLALIVYIFAKWKYQYWKRRGVAQLEPEFFFGNVKKLFLMQDCLAGCYTEHYKKFKAMGVKHGGIYTIFRPTWIPIAPELIKRVMQNDFHYFTSHAAYYHQLDDLSLNIFNLDGGDDWKSLRAKLSPTFTSGKIKMMFETLLEKVDVLKNVTDDYAANNKSVDIKALISRFTTDVIGSVAFGIECNSLTEPEDNAFRKYGDRSLAPSWARTWCEGFFPHGILPYIGYKSFGGAELQEFFKNIVRATVHEREKNNIYRKDFMHLLIQLKNRGELSSGDSISKTTTKGEYSITEKELIAQTFVFFVAGFDTSATTTTFALYELAKNQEIQQKVRQEINEVLEKHDWKLTYEAVADMTYTEKVIKEALRKHPPLAAIPRECTKDYQVPGTDSVIEKGTIVQIPVLGIHRDPEYYPNPDQFNPDNFDKENISSRPDFTYIPFGEGPRICMGMRFGTLQAKVGLISMVRHYRFSVNSKTSEPLEYAPGNAITTAKGGVWLDLEKVE